MNISFLAGVDNWAAGLGKLRDVVRQEVLAEQLREVMSTVKDGPADVLDIGCGQGTQALRLARAGHTVTGLDISVELLDRFESALSAEPADVRARVRLVVGPGEAAPDIVPGPFDAILCHGVLPYLDDLAPMLGAISGVAAPQATLSLLVRNGAA
ncbi:MAG: methyltransferase domain-containing protein, partial [Actinomycetota bacterium]|nr:methyltransferase domain-containing protein [Actinomycetota bacterium]